MCPLAVFTFYVHNIFFSHFFHLHNDEQEYISVIITKKRMLIKQPIQKQRNILFLCVLSALQDNILNPTIEVPAVPSDVTAITNSIYHSFIANNANSTIITSDLLYKTVILVSD